MTNSFLYKVKALKPQEFLEVYLIALYDSTANVQVSITPGRRPGISIPVECDFCSSVTEKNYGDVQNCSIIQRKRIGINGLTDMHWVGFIDKDQPQSWQQIISVGYWIL